MNRCYRKTACACYAADILQAIVINVTPIVFVLLKAEYGLRYSQFGTLDKDLPDGKQKPLSGCSKRMDTRGTHSHKMEGRGHKPAVALSAAPGHGKGNFAKCGQMCGQ